MRRHKTYAFYSPYKIMQMDEEKKTQNKLIQVLFMNNGSEVDSFTRLINSIHVMLIELHIHTFDSRETCVIVLGFHILPQLTSLASFRIHKQIKTKLVH